MEFILPSGKAVELQSFPRKVQIELIRLNTLRAADEQRTAQGDAQATERLLRDEFFEKREAAMSALYRDLGPWDDLPNRDAQKLIDATWAFSIGIPEEEIKNLSRSGATIPHQTEQNTAEPAETKQP